MRSFYLISCLAVVTVMTHSQPIANMGLQKQYEKNMPLNAHVAKPHIYQQLPQKQSLNSFAASAPSYDIVTATGLSSDIFAPVSSVTDLMNIPQEDTYNAAYHHSTSQQHQNGYYDGPTETEVYKHIYVHVPPKDFEDEEAIQARVTHQAGPKQKHYKIVFIKTPSGSGMHLPIVPPAPQIEEKTLIYVLHKKPETQTDFVIPTAAPTKPSKPEVYFIKYKTKKEEAPVYGPPPATNNFESRYNTDAGNPMDLGSYGMAASTNQPQYLDGQSKFLNDESSATGSELYNASTMNHLVNEEVQPTVPAEPLNEYLPPETTSAPIIVKDMAESIRTPAVTYGPPNHIRYFIKKRK